MRIDFTLGPSGQPQRRSAGPTRRILVLTDLRGNGTTTSDRLLDRPIVKVDLDNVDEVLAHVAPAVQLGAAAGGERLEFRRFDDFHPDALVDSQAAFRRLRDLRSRLGHPSTFAAAVAELQTDAPPAPVLGIGAAPGQADGLSTLERLLGHKQPGLTSASAPAPPSPQTVARAADALIRQAIAPHIVPAPSPQLPQMLAAVDAAMTDLMRAVLHDPAFQAVESTWRAVQWLVTTLELGETLELLLLHVTHDELSSASAQDGDLWRRLVEREARPDGGPKLSVLAGNFRFSPSASDVTTLEAMGTLAAALGVPFLAEASATLLGVESLASQPDPREWSMLSGDDDARWRALRVHPAAAHVGLALPRFLLRFPYGQRTDPITAFRFEEQRLRPEHDAFLWGNPAFAAAVVVARALDPDGDPGEAGSLEGIPTFSYTIDDEACMQPAAEICPSEAAVVAIQARGIMPLIAFKDRDALRLVAPHSIADPPVGLLA